MTSKPATSQVSRLFDRPYLLLTLATLFWSGNFVLGRAVRLDVPPIGLAFWRWTGASLIIIGFAWPHLRREWPLVIQHWKIILLLSFMGITVFNTLIYTGLQFTFAINALLMQSTMPVVIMLMSYVFFRDVINGWQGFGIVLSMAGVVTIIAQGQLAVLLGLSFNAGDVLVFIAVLCYATYSVFLRQRPTLHPLTFIAVSFIWGTLMLSPFYIWEHTSGRVMQFNLVTALAVGYVMIFPSILSYLCFNRGVDLAGSNRAGMFLHLMPAFGSLMAIVFLGERFQLYHLVGIALILSGIVLATQIGQKR